MKGVRTRENGNKSELGWAPKFLRDEFQLRTAEDGYQNLFTNIVNQ